MRFFRTEVWSYAVLLIILFAIGTVAVLELMEYLESQLAHEEYRIVAVIIWTMTLGFMFIAGAFGLWAVQFSAERESRLRVGRFVDAMDYLSDGLLAVDKNGIINGSNPAARNLTTADLDGKIALNEAFDCVEKNDLLLLLGSDEPNEVEKKISADGKSRTIRFRSQPSEDLILILVSDVTNTEIRRMRNRQAARLQLIGQIARGVANDFNDLLCAINGHAALLVRAPTDSRQVAESAASISSAAERGTSLAGHLLELARYGGKVRSTELIENHIESAVEMIRNSLSANWQIESSFRSELPPVGMTGLQIEQVVTNLGLIAADSLSSPGLLRISVSTPGHEPPFDVGREFAGVILIETIPVPEAAGKTVFELQDTAQEPGLLESVIRSLIEESEGGLDFLASSSGGDAYRVRLPAGDIVEKTGNTELSEELKQYVKGWHILLASAGRARIARENRFSELEISVYSRKNLASALTAIEEAAELDAIVIDEQILGHEGRGLIKAMTKLRPNAGITVMTGSPDSQPAELSSQVAFVDDHAHPDQVIMAAIKARSMARGRSESLNA